MYRYALLVLGDESAAEDAVQETFCDLIRAARHQEITAAYAFGAVRNRCFSMLRRRRWGQGKAVLLEPLSPDASEEERLMLDQALRGLPLEQREVIYLKVFEGYTLREIAELCGISINTVGSRLRYGLAALRHALRTETL